MPTLYPALLVAAVLLVTLMRVELQDAIEDFVVSYQDPQPFGYSFTTITQIFLSVCTMIAVVLVTIWGAIQVMP